MLVDQLLSLHLADQTVILRRMNFRSVLKEAFVSTLPSTSDSIDLLSILTFRDSPDRRDPEA